MIDVEGPAGTTLRSRGVQKKHEKVMQEYRNIHAFCHLSNGQISFTISPSCLSW
jgi:hypothetical protein